MRVAPCCFELGVLYLNPIRSINEERGMVALQAQTIEVSVFPDRARVTRRGTLALAAGVQTVELADLPLSLVPDSVRAAGRGSADNVLLGVNTRRAYYSETPSD